MTESLNQEHFDALIEFYQYKMLFTADNRFLCYQVCKNRQALGQTSRSGANSLRRLNFFF